MIFIVYKENKYFYYMEWIYLLKEVWKQFNIDGEDTLARGHRMCDHFTLYAF